MHAWIRALASPVLLLETLSLAGLELSRIHSHLPLRSTDFCIVYASKGNLVTVELLASLLTSLVTNHVLDTINLFHTSKHLLSSEGKTVTPLLFDNTVVKQVALNSYPSLESLSVGRFSVSDVLALHSFFFLRSLIRNFCLYMYA